MSVALEEEKKEPLSEEQPELIQEGRPLSKTELEPAPDGGLRAWLVAVGAASAFFCCLGFANSFGTFEEYYLTHQLSHRSPDEIAWIGSLASFLQFFSGLVGGPLFDRYGIKIVYPAAVLYIFAVLILSACKTYWQILLVQGVLMGITMGFILFPAMTSVSHYFDKKRATALGVAISGSSIGGIVMPILVSKLLNSTSLGFGWTIRIIGFVMLPFIIFSVLAIKARLPPRTTALWIPSAFRDAKYNFLIASTFFILIGMFLPIIFLPTYAVEKGVDATLAGYLPAIINGASTFGRIIPGILADKYGQLNVFALGSIATSIIVFPMTSAKTEASIIVYAIFFGFASGTIISGATVSITGCADDPRNIGAYTGMGLALGGLGALVGPPINGAFVSHYHGFFEATMFSGAFCLFGSILVLMAKIASPQGLFCRS
ncbi:hypothetical protein Trco_001393 [Trichoderma cornu-damae]|uniref:Major facilitator superfamily (MFS) profile domain-containing protein n=1 Tax=Trichoderma cornu-damae TaxID=654480 RepID=A0A9P8QXV3_9HYPO|nr:hypothetical protein Trco_001393 [Trichoderma cornu-damae]